MNKLEKKYSKEDLTFLAYILNSTWESQFKTTGEIMKERINSGSLFAFAYGFPTKEEKEKYQEVCGLEAPSEIPLGVLETIALRTEGYFGNVPNSYESLTKNGLWKPPEKDADTLILVDITILETRRGKKGNGEAKIIVNTALDGLARNNLFNPLKFVWTYTPNIEKVKKWHESLEAEKTQCVLYNARSNFVEPNVYLMNYTQKLENLRKHYFPSTIAKQ